MPPADHRFGPDAQAEYNQAIRYYVMEADETVAAKFIAQMKADVTTI